MASEVLQWLSSPEHVNATRKELSSQRSREDAYLAALELRRDVQGVVHVAGTKGKGSTCGMVESMLRSAGYSTLLFTSPHLHDPRERIRINGEPIDEGRFDDVVLKCHRKLKEVESSTIPFPAYFRFLKLVAMVTQKELKSEAVVLEVGIGGRYDPTNCIERPWACGVASIGMDHMELLGDTIEEIASEKGGILKPQVPGFTVAQRSEAMSVLRRCATEAQTTLMQTQPSDFVNWDDVDQNRRLKGYQRENAALAVALSRAYEQRFSIEHQSTPARIRRLESLENKRLPDEYLGGLEQFYLPGRIQILSAPRLPRNPPESEYVPVENVCLYLDGAHTIESLDAAAAWLQSEWKESRQLDFVLFNCHILKDPNALVGSLHSSLQRYQLLPSSVFFAPQWTHRDSLLPVKQKLRPMEWQEKLMTSWCTTAPRSSTPSLQLPPLASFVHDSGVIKRRFPHTRAEIFRTLPSALHWFGEVGRRYRHHTVRVFITGSLYFVSDVLKLVQKSP